ncbi:pilus assembly protein CpaE [Palleronia sediminis]|uniref:Pilus assembly protein CpaE n=1 Tax=Palleronia sediminis TaxID=2547833 RepID=A0A4R6A5C5_9RHOB|nr:AAA family ATPase [Palleronia sediminis]TDL76316.1 pilus assembly protein CpaE [Palleronia sediminis]
MAGNLAVAPDPAPFRACTVSRDVQQFDLLIDDMETVFGEDWGDLSFAEARAFLGQPDAADLRILALAIDTADTSELPFIELLVAEAHDRGIKVLVVAEDIKPVDLHRILRKGASEFLPYPLPENALREAVARLEAPEPAVAPPVEQARLAAPARMAGGNRNGVILPVQGLAGGVGASTFAVNLANELSLLSKGDDGSVCLLDLDLQTGSSATYLDLVQREAVFELLSDTETMDDESFRQALVPHDDRLWTLTAPAEILPLDIIGPEDVDRLIDAATAQFDYVVIDMPRTVVHWTETVLNRAHVFFSLLEIDMRSAQNALRLLRALKAEDLPVEKLRFILNRAPKFTDLAGKSRVKQLAQSLDISLEVQLPDGGRPVSEACDRGVPLAEAARKNPLRREIAKLAASAHELNREASKVG